MTQLPRWHWIAPILFAIFLIWIYPQTGLDHALIAPYYDAQRGFFLKNEEFLTFFMHDTLKTLMLLVVASFIFLLAWSWQEPRLQAHRRRITWILLGMGLATLSVSISKSLSIHACPWDLSQFGGYAPEIPLFGNLPSGLKPGRCLPGGHASGGYALLALYFGLLTLSKTWAYRGLAAALVIGTAMGWSQMMRGAHFLSHNLWTLLIVWCVLTLLYSVWPPITSRQLEVCHA
jgi:membrane-associated PAP2 superfamily phosphatase